MDVAGQNDWDFLMHLFFHCIRQIAIRRCLYGYIQNIVIQLESIRINYFALNYLFINITILSLCNDSIHLHSIQKGFCITREKKIYLDQHTYRRTHTCAMLLIRQNREKTWINNNNNDNKNKSANQKKKNKKYIHSTVAQNCNIFAIERNSHFQILVSKALCALALTEPILFRSEIVIFLSKKSETKHLLNYVHVRSNDQRHFQYGRRFSN